MGALEANGYHIVGPLGEEQGISTEDNEKLTAGIIEAFQDTATTHIYTCAAEVALRSS